MKPGVGRISWTQIAFGIICTIQGSALLTAFVAGVTGYESWIAMLASMVAAVPLIWMYLSVAKIYPDLSIIQINDRVFGPIFGKVISFNYLFYFFNLAAFNTRDMSAFTAGYILPGTPFIVIAVVFGFVCVQAVRSGVEPMMRYSTMFGVFSITAVLAFLILLVPNMNPEHLIPIGTLPLIKYVQAVHILTIIPIGECIVFLMVLPNLNKHKDAGKAMYFGMFGGAVILLLILLRDYMVLGPIAPKVALASFESIRMINIANILTRMEVIYALILILLLFFKVSIFLYGTVRCIGDMLGMKSFRSIVLPVGAIVVGYSLFVFNSSMENASWGAEVAPWFSGYFEVVIPLLTLIVAKLRKLPGKNPSAAQAEDAA